MAEYQNMLHQINDLANDMEILFQRNQRSPCISLSGLRNLELYKKARQCDKDLTLHSFIHMLFQLLKIPQDWIFQIGHPPQVVFDKSSHTIPFEAYIYLTHDSLKLSVYRTLLKHIRKTKQNAVHVKVVNW
jgi:hypothetical protein